jgi:hypothetical protein
LQVYDWCQGFTVLALFYVQSNFEGSNCPRHHRQVKMQVECL